MKMKPFGVIILAAIVSSCSHKFDEKVLETKFTFPNSNVKTLGFVSAEESATVVSIPFVENDFSLRDMRKRVLDQALDQQQADLLIDSRWITETTMIPVLPVAITKLRIEGTAATMDLGRQNIR